MMKKSYIIMMVMCLALISGQAVGQDNIKSWTIKARVGYSIGGTAPIGVPATIRSIDKFSLTPSLMAGADVSFALQNRWGLMTGLRIENKAMDVDVTTKSYRMELVKGDSKIEGLFTGHVSQEVTEWMFTVPVMATYKLSNKVTLKGGPYMSVLIDKDFSGIASDGYLRQGDPVGPKIIMGDKPGEWATYDFSNDMRNTQFGLEVGADWQVHKNLGLSADLSWGLTGIFKSDFKTVEQTLYPIYGTLGAYWKF